ncbi:hypothetical protein [Rathayibacter tanaceti]|uniref:Uncharacterized protein n=2 Tax=Rathayibacter tanaceti TaxID=1671680 RepID=A0A162J0G4_9MICO|nr:hypothetical protein [Rathayibacter tanaceti]KZX20407.1 hypothetical protein ACH61_02487 [Rathayibacter tanaceti]QHC54405.1 hypothetical protein GSU10_01155 [Rathayibacter tanaceti]TCO35119.1 hypothetical protein EV639_109123 [Rathayibacter tanaceti]
MAAPIGAGIGVVTATVVYGALLAVVAVGLARRLSGLLDREQSSEPAVREQV